MDFKNKTVIITGGSAGVGAATARAFAMAGANLMLVARDKKNLEATAAELRNKTRVEIMPMDVSDLDACADLFKKAHFEFGHIDVLVNNAGFHQRGHVESIETDDLASMIDVNLRAPIVLSRLALPHFAEAGAGAIINVGSLAGRTPVPNSATYSASKSGLRAFSHALAEELRGSNIKVALVSPGPIDTGFIMADVDRVSNLTFSQPISTAAEVAEVILDLCSNRHVEQSMPALSGFLTTVTYLMPWLGRIMRPALERKGARVKRRIKSEQQASAS
jgi:short-subunit dehydrogenase